MGTRETVASAPMDLSERGSATARHPWEIERFRAYRNVLRDHGALGARRVLDVGAGDGWFSESLLAELPDVEQIVCWDINYNELELATDDPRLAAHHRRSRPRVRPRARARRARAHRRPGDVHRRVVAAPRRAGHRRARGCAGAPAAVQRPRSCARTLPPLPARRRCSRRSAAGSTWSSTVRCSRRWWRPARRRSRSSGSDRVPMPAPRPTPVITASGRGRAARC